MKKIFCFILVFCVFSSMACLSSLAAAPAAGETTYTNHFDSEADLDDWQAYYIIGAGESQEENFSNHWSYKDGSVTRINDIVKGQGTKYIASLSLKDMTFKNFELSVKYQKTGTDWPWAVVAIRQNFPGKYFLDDGLGIFVQDEGMATFWGGSECGGPYEGTKDSSYKPNDPHVMKITAVNDLITVYIDGKQVQQKSFVSLIREGYISLMAVNNTITFDDFSITKLDNSGNPTAIVEDNATVTTAAAATNSVSAISGNTSSAASTTSNNVSSSVSGSSSVSTTTTSNSTKTGNTTAISLDDLETNGGNSTGSHWWIWLIVIGGIVVIGGGGAALYFFVIRKKTAK